MEQIMKTKLLQLSTISIIIFGFSGCALDEALADNYRANKNYNASSRTAQKRSEAKRKFVQNKTAELVSMYGSKRGYLIAQKVLTDKNIQYNYDSQNFYPFVDNSVVIKYINETRDLEKNRVNKETIIIIRE